MRGGALNPSTNKWKAYLEPRYLSGVLGLAIAYAFLAKLSLDPPVPGFEFWRVIWLPTGVAFTTIVFLGPRYWPGIALGAFTGTMITSGPVLYALGTGVGNTVEIVGACWLLRRWGFHPGLRRTKDVIGLVVFGAGVATGVTALFSVTTMVAAGEAPVAAYPRISLQWWLGHALGMVVIAPPLLTVFAPRRDRALRRPVELAALVALLVVVSQFVFTDSFGASGYRYPLAFTPFPLLLWAAFRFGPPGAAWTNLLTTGIAIWGTTLGDGPFVTESTNSSLYLTWIFVNVAALTTLLVAAIVCETRDTEARLRASEELNRRIVEAIPGGIVRVATDGAITFANAEAQRILGLSHDTQSHRYVADFERSTVREDGSPFPVGEYPVTKCLETGRPQPREIIGTRTEEGRTTWAVYTAVPVRAADGEGAGGAIVTFLDITDRKEIERRLTDSEGRWRSLVENVPDMIVVMDGAGTISYVNRPPARRPAEAFAGQSIYSFIHPEDIDNARQTLGELVVSGRSAFSELRLLDADGQPRWFSVRVGPVGEEHPVTQLIVVATDVTERKRTQEAIQHTQKLESLGVLAGGIAHDFNNLLVGVLGNADLALMDLHADQPGVERVQEIRRAAVRASELTNQMLTYAGRANVDKTPLDINRIVEEMGNLLGTVVSKKALIDYHLGPRIPRFVGDGTQIRQVIMNLITNASEALSDEGGRIAVRTGVVSRRPDDQEFRGAPHGPFVWVEVADTGQGMDAETQGKMFDPFFTTKFAGRGLGLAAVVGIIHSHGGDIAVESAPGQGTTVRVFFPVTDLSAPTAPDDRTDDEQWRGSGRVLVVDDEESVRAVVQAMLESVGFSVLTAKDGHEGVEVFRDHCADLSVVLLDMTMPRMGGEEAFREIHRIEDTIPVILLSGYAEDDAVERVTTRGLAGFLHKPFERAALVSVLRNVLPS